MGAMRENWMACMKPKAPPPPLTDEQRAELKKLARAEPRTPLPHLDFSFIPKHQYEIHDRLANWAKWCYSRGRGDVAPGFDLHKSDAWDMRVYGAPTVMTVDKFDAARVASAVAGLPQKHRLALNWFYLNPKRGPLRVARELAVTPTMLAQLVIDGRQMLINRGI